MFFCFFYHVKPAVCNANHSAWTQPIQLCDSQRDPAGRAGKCPTGPAVCLETQVKHGSVE